MKSKFKPNKRHPNPKWRFVNPKHVYIDPADESIHFRHPPANEEETKRVMKELADEVERIMKGNV